MELMIYECDVPLAILRSLFQTVKDKLGERELGSFPFYTKVDLNLLRDIVDIDKVSTGYIYAHDEPIPLHVDRYKESAKYNFNIPIWVQDDSQEFLVFNQEYTRCGCEWQAEGIDQIRHQPLTDEDLESSNEDNDHVKSLSYKGIRPWETEGVIGLTDRPVNIKRLPYDKDFYFGLDGISWHQKMGKGLLFKSSQIHGTGVQSKFKVGCVLMLESRDALLV